MPDTRFTVSKTGFSTRVFSAVNTAEGRYYAINKDAPINRFPYMQWDAVGYYVDGTQTGDQAFNTITSGVASNMCKDCPTASMIYAYLLCGAYWDDGTHTDDDQPNYGCPDGSVQHTGLWLPRNEYIKANNLLSVATGDSKYDGKGVEDYDGTVNGGVDMITESCGGIITSTTSQQDTEKIRSIGNYFFLPASGAYYENSYVQPGTYGFYWSSTPYGIVAGDACSWCLNFHDNYASVTFGDCTLGCQSWTGL